MSSSPKISVGTTKGALISMLNYFIISFDTHEFAMYACYVLCRLYLICKIEQNLTYLYFYNYIYITSLQNLNIYSSSTQQINKRHGISFEARNLSVIFLCLLGILHTLQLKQHIQCASF